MARFGDEIRRVSIIQIAQRFRHSFGGLFRSEDDVGNRSAPCRLTRQFLRAVQCTTGKNVTVAGSVNQFNPLSNPGKLDRMLANNIACTAGGIPHRGAAAFGTATQSQRRPAGGIELVDVMLLVNIALPSGVRQDL